MLVFFQFYIILYLYVAWKSQVGNYKRVENVEQVFSLNANVEKDCSQQTSCLFRIVSTIIEEERSNMKSGVGNNYSDLIGYTSRSPRSKFMKNLPKSIQGSNSSLSNGQSRKQRPK